MCKDIFIELLEIFINKILYELKRERDDWKRILNERT